MSNQDRVYVRKDENSPWELASWNSIKHFWNGDMWVQIKDSFADYRKAVQFRDLDLDNITADCVVCRMVTCDLCEGDIFECAHIDTKLKQPRVLFYDPHALHCWNAADFHSGYQTLAAVLFHNTITPIGHTLTHEWDKKAGKAVAR